MILKVNATRMELTRLKKDLNIALSGHKLLKDKRDEMMRRFIALKKEATTLRTHLENVMQSTGKLFSFASAAVGQQEFQNCFILSGIATETEKENSHIMNVAVPKYKVISAKKQASALFPTSDLKAGVDALQKERDNFIKLGELEMSIKLLASELEKTRRHVNSLEYVTIPNYRETIHYIRMRIEENTRSNTARLIKVKDMVLQEKLSNKK